MLRHSALDLLEKVVKTRIFDSFVNIHCNLKYGKLDKPNLQVPRFIYCTDKVSINE